MKSSIYLVFNRKKVISVRTGRLAPTLKSGEFTVRLNITVPDVFFDRAIPQANLTVDEKSIIAGPAMVATEPAPRITP